MWSVFTHVFSSHTNLLKQKKVLTIEKNSTLTWLVWHTNMTAVSLRAFSEFHFLLPLRKTARILINQRKTITTRNTAEIINFTFALL